jgi:two-component system, cell cycle sensor histidine kinase and response regulator CckA
MNRVLIVDDNPDNLYMLRSMLQGYGYVVEEAGHGAEALGKARRTPPSLIISDLLMPVMDGYTLLRHWKADERLKSIPFVVFTATYTDPKDERLALNLGADAFIIKPVEPEPFLARLREVLAKNVRGELMPGKESPMEDNVLFKDYSEVVVRKLEEKVLQLEQTNRALVAEIAERKKSDAALQLRERAIRAATQGLLITDPGQPDNGIVYVSPGFERITGYASDEVLGRNCRFLQGRDTDPSAVAQLREAILAGEPCTVELLNYRKNGSPFWNELSISPVRDDSGRLTHFVGVQVDVTARRNLEEQFRQVQKMEAVGQLAGGVAHDFNNLLTIINGYSAVLLRSLPPGDPSLGLVAEIHTAGERSAGLTRQLLAFSRKQVLAPRMLDLNKVTGNTDKLLRRLIGEDVRLTATLDPELWAVRADPGQIEQVLMNLAVNARDAMPRGGRLTIETRNVELDEGYARLHPDARAGPYVLLSVTDTGCGMTPEVQARIFEPFFTTKAPGKGTGLGLSTVYGIVKQSGGHVAAYSEVGIGTTFKVYLPRVEQLVEEKVRSRPQTTPKGTETILLVEDDDGVRSITRHMLTGFGYHVLEACNGDEAIRAANGLDRPIHLLITDVVIPGASGRVVAESVVARHPGARVLFVSGYTGDAVVRHGILEEKIHFLPKPFSPDSLAMKVRDILDQTGA